MKKLLVTLVLTVSCTWLFAQKLDKAKDLYEKKKYPEAKAEIEKVVASDKYKGNAEALYTQGKIYVAMSEDEALKATMPDARDQALSSMKQYLDVADKNTDSAKRYLLLMMDGNKPLVDIYSGYNKDGATFYNANNFNDASTNFGKSLEVFDMMSKRKLIPHSFDTTTVLYAGISAEKASKKDVAAQYYGMIAERKIKSDGFIEIYKWVADYYNQKGDLANASKFIKIGKEVYPEDPFWVAYELDMVREKGTKEQLFAKYEEAIAANPANHLFKYNYAVELYQAGYAPEIAKRPANSKELIQKATDQLAKCTEQKPDYASAQMLLGQIYYNEGVDINNEQKAIRPPTGGKLKPEELKKKNDMRADVSKKFDQAVPYFEKVDQLLGSQGKLKMDDKQILKDAYDLLITIFETKENKPKADEYTNKFNDVDRKH